MSEILMKEMEILSIGPMKAEQLKDGPRSFLLVDEEENLQVKLAELMLTVSWLAKAELTLSLIKAYT